MLNKVRVYGKDEKSTILGLINAYLTIIEGISAERLSTEGKGSSEPLDVDCSELNR